jgi:hypothetical protein
MKSEDIKSETNTILGEEVSVDLQKWYSDIISRRSRYVVFLVRRCYMLALIMEQVTGKKMLDEAGKIEYLTDAAMLLRAPELAEHYRNAGYFPDILLYDDILIHGRNINRLLEYMEDLLVAELPEYEPDEIRGALADAVGISVYVRANGPILLFPRYELHLKSERVEDTSFWRKLSSDISTLITRLGVANASYIISAGVDPEIVEKLDLEPDSEWNRSVYFNNLEYARVALDAESGYVYAIKTLRIIKSEVDDAYRAIPFVFMPNLSGEETLGIWRELSLYLKEYKEWDKYGRILTDWMHIKGMRSFNEWLSLLWSNAVLREFQKEYGIRFDETDLEAECRKLARNYNWGDIEETIDFLRWTVCTVDVKASDLTAVLLHNIEKERYLLEVDSASDAGFEPEDLEALEDIFYDQACRDERDAYETLREFLPPMQKRTVRHLKDVRMVFREAGYDKVGADIIQAAVSYFLQMMDAGIVALSSYPATDIRVVGYSQFVKTGEQSLYIWPTRYCEYLPFLYRVEDRCEQTNRWIREELIAYFSSDQCKISGSVKEKLIIFVDRMATMGQRPSDWRISYVYKYEKEEGEDLLSATLNRIAKHRSYVKDYTRYLENI